MDKELTTRACRAARRYLEHKGLEVIEQVDYAELPVIVSDDAGELVFASVAAEYGAFPGEPMGRRSFERVAARYLIDNACYDTPVRFDAIEMMVVANDRALLRCHMNCLGCACEA